MPPLASFDKDEFYKMMESLLNAASGSVKSTQTLKDLKNWDSLAILELIVMADNEYGSDMQPTEISACKTIEDLAEPTFAHGARSQESVTDGPGA